MYIVERDYGWDYEGNENSIVGVFTSLSLAKEAVKEWMSANWEDHTEIDFIELKRTTPTPLTASPVEYILRYDRIGYKDGNSGDFESICISRTKFKDKLII